MKYFEKIEAYFDHQLSAMERDIFEQELTENPLFQKEFEAYQFAQNLFNFTGSSLSDIEILESSALSTATDLIGFTAKNLSETQILSPAILPRIEKIATVRSLSFYKRKNWLIAASTVLVLATAAIAFWSQPTIKSEIVKVEIPEIKKQIKPEIPIVQVSSHIAAVEVSKKKELIKTPTKKKIQKPIKKHNTRVIQKSITPVEKFAIQELPKTAIPSLVIKNNLATEISTNAFIPNGQTVVYQAGSSITLKAGFYASAGSNFAATSIAQQEVNDIAIDATISNRETVIYKAGNSITLKAGFHVKVGADFAATVENGGD